MLLTILYGTDLIVLQCANPIVCVVHYGLALLLCIFIIICMHMQVLSAWNSDLAKLVSLVESTTHLVRKETASLNCA